jgi:hypothetical protein
MKVNENKDYEWARPLDEYLYKISSVTQEYECENIESLLSHIRSKIWQSDYIVSRGIIENLILEVEGLIENLSDHFKDLTYYLGDEGKYIDKDDIISDTTHNLNRLLKELKSLQKALLRKIKASLPGGIEKDGIRIKSHLTAETLVAFFKALKKENIVFDKETPNVLLAKFISANFSTDKSTQAPLSIEYLEDLISSEHTVVSIQFKRKLKNILREIE